MKLIVAEYKDVPSLYHAAEAFRDKGYTHFETYSPFPIHGMDKAMGLKPSKLGWISICGGILGCLTGITLQTWVSTKAYALVISGKPLASFPAFIPVTFELSILFTAFATVFGMFALNKLPEWYHVIFNHSRFHLVTSHGFFISVEDKDPQYNEPVITTLFNETGGESIEVVTDEK